MSDMKCPFCQQELHKDSDGYYTCYTDNCESIKYGGNGASGSESLWKTLITTRKALDVAVERLKNIILDVEVLATPEYLADRAKETLEQINEIEGGDNE